MNHEYRMFWKLVGTIYTLVTVSVGLATTVYFAVSKSKPSHAEFHEIFFASLYAFGTFAVATLFWRTRGLRDRQDQEELQQEQQQQEQQQEQQQQQQEQQQDQEQADVNSDVEGDGLAGGQEDEDVGSHQIEQPGVVFTGEGFNVYLRIGLVVFLIGSVSLNLLRAIAQLLHSPSGECSRAASLLMNLLEIAFTVSQAVLILRHHRAVILRHKAQSRMAFAHLFTANICIWASSAIGEIKEQLANERRNGEAVQLLGNETGHGAPRNRTDHAGDASCEAPWRLVDSVRPFLTPAVIEYCLLAAPMVLHMMVSIGEHGAVENAGRHPLAVTAASTDASESAAATSATPSDCQLGGLLRHRFAKSRVGLAFCIAAFAATASVTVAVYQFLTGLSATVAYLVQDLLLSGIGIGLCAAMRQQMKRLGLAKCERHTFDDKLLTFALFGSLVYQVTMLVVISDHSEVFPVGYIVAELASILICAFQLCLQTFCLLDALRRRARGLAESQAKPGVGLVLALLGVNLSMWIMETFEVRKAEELLFSYRLSNVSESALKIIIHIGQPINIFYRFHSTVCLSIIWRKAYEPHLQDTVFV